MRQLSRAFRRATRRQGAAARARRDAADAADGARLDPRGARRRRCGGRLQRRGTRAREKYPEVPVARTLDELLVDKEIQLCVIATPNDSHFEYARACLMAGRDVVVDKPFAPTLRESEELVRLAAERGRLITVYQDRRWDGDFGTVKTIVASGRLGTVVEYECRYDRFRLEPKENAWRERKRAGKSRSPCSSLAREPPRRRLRRFDRALAGSRHTGDHVLDGVDEAADQRLHGKG